MVTHWAKIGTEGSRIQLYRIRIVSSRVDYHPRRPAIMKENVMEQRMPSKVRMVLNSTGSVVLHGLGPFPFSSGELSFGSTRFLIVGDLLSTVTRNYPA